MRAFVLFVVSLSLCLTQTGLALSDETNVLRIEALAEPNSDIELAAAADGRMAELLVAEGARVSAGQVIARLDDRVQGARVAMARIAAEARSEREKAETLLALAKERLARMETARLRGGITAWELAEAEQQIEIAEADLAAARDRASSEAARLEMEQALLADHTLAAPFGGVVNELKVDVGENVRRGEPIARLLDLEQLKLTVFLPVDVLPRIDRAKPVMVRAPAPFNSTLEGAFSFIDSVVEPASRTVRATVVVPNADAKLPAGMILTLLLNAKAEG